MAKLNEKDGLSRRQRIENLKVSGELKLMDESLHTMGQRLSSLYHHINYYNLQNKKEGTFGELIQRSLFFVISNIKQFNLEQEEKEFLSLLSSNYHDPETKEELLLGKIIGMVMLFESWIDITSNTTGYDYKLTLRTDLINQVVVNLSNTTSQLSTLVEKRIKTIKFPKLSGIWSIEKTPVNIIHPLRFYKSAFYKFFNSIQFLQKNAGTYEEELFLSGYNEPSVAIFIAFLLNHNKVINTFNNRWKAYSTFYLEKILMARPAKAIPDSTIIQIRKKIDKEWVEINQGTQFLAGEKIRFSATEPLWVNNIVLKSVLGLYEEEDGVVEPASWLGHVTALKKVDLGQFVDIAATEVTARPIFEQKGKKSGENHPSLSGYTSVGLMIRSWSLLLNEGIRKITLRLHLTDDSVESYHRLVSAICERWGEIESEVVYKLLSDVFYVKISTLDGWRNIETYTMQFVGNADNSAFEINFSVDESFPPICSLETEPSKPPSVQLMLNRNAWLFPYTWLKEFEFSSVKIITEVTGLSSIQLYSELGKLDTTMPFYPFGMLPSRGAWMVFGSHEMAVKKIKNIDLRIKWANLPTDSYGFADYYFQYNKDIDNRSFIVEPEVLKNRKWMQVKRKNYFLFNTDTGDGEGQTKPKAPLNTESLLSEIVPEDFNRQIIRAEEYTFNMFSANGFFRLRLVSPDMGFGHQHYHRLLSDVLMHNARSRKMMNPPNTPFSPQAESMTISYISEDEISALRASDGFGEALYHIHPFGQHFLDVFATRKPFKIIPDFESRGNLLFGFENVEGGETIKLYLALSPQQKEIDRDKFPQITWFYGDGFKWTLFSQNDIIRDETNNLLESGIIEIKIPPQIPDIEKSLDNLFWIRAAIMLNIESLSEVKGFYLHVVKAERLIGDDPASLEYLNALQLGKIDALEHRTPEIESVVQLVQTSGGRVSEDEISMKVRLSERISHRNRAVNAIDFEKIILEEFTSIRKAKCFPGIDSKQARLGVVTIAVIPETEQKVRAPMASCKQLIDIENFIQRYSTMFATIDVINPVYEHIQVRCKVTLAKTRSEGYFLRLLNHEINNYIAFWEARDEPPVFGHSISLIDLANFIRSRDYVVRVKNFSVLHLREKQEFLYELIEKREHGQDADHDIKTTIKVLLNNHEIEIKELKPISPSKPWAIIIPIEKHLLVADWEDQVEKAGINELEIGNTFVIN